MKFPKDNLLTHESVSKQIFCIVENGDGKIVVGNKSCIFFGYCIFPFSGRRNRKAEASQATEESDIRQ